MDNGILPNPTSVDSTPRWWNFWTSRLSTLILVGLLTGIACGVFFGEYCALLSTIGDVYIGLLQMTVLPYIAVELVANLGRLSLAETRRLAAVGGLVLLVLWGIAFATILVLTAGFPKLSSGSFYSSALIEPSTGGSLLPMFVPSNIFQSLAENQVPAIVLFCICAGIALATVKGRQSFIAQLAIGANDVETRDFLEHWVTLRQKDGTMQEFYDHWILGKTAVSKGPRWCVIRDVLQWVE